MRSKSLWTDLADSEKKREKSWLEWIVRHFKRSYGMFCCGCDSEDLGMRWCWRKYKRVDNLKTSALARVVFPKRD